MSTHSVSRNIGAETRGRAVTLRPVLLAVLGPLTSLSGLVWAIVQPYRVTLLHPDGQGFWWLAVEPPLLVIVAGLAFHYFIARPLIDDLERI